MITDYHAKLYAHELLRRHPSDSVERFTAALMDSAVDLNPHQVDAALFAFRSPLSKGAILADEVGLGKTIEAGIVLSQKWAERKRKILIILPSSLRKQWHQELLDKFYLPSQILESKSFNRAIKGGKRNPFDSDEIVLCSYPFARNKSEFVRSVSWDLVVVDEAHRLRNVYKTGNKIARELKDALSDVPKLLLTATPLQNTLLELYGLVSFIDEHTFGDLKSFKNQFARLTTEDTFSELKARLEPVCKRTLRRQVLEYIRYTERKAHTQEFVPTSDEDALYDLVSEYLRRPNLKALPASQRTLMTLVLRKLLASSTFAIAGALNSLANKLESQLRNDERYVALHEEMEEDFETFEEMQDEFGDEFSEEYEPLTDEDKEKLKAEIEELREFHDLAMSITQNAKGEALLNALRVGFKMTTDLGGAEKAVIFTESRRTQNYLVQLLSDAGYGDDIVLFNGSNNDGKSKELYQAWKAEHEGTDKFSGSRTADTRAAIVEHFRTEGKVMIATEAAAEGINLQFCSLVVNYDLPWNPQRIEQRIGRCHRYGQQHDVVVINFLNKNNAADQRVYQLLSEKFHLFSGVFGASDSPLGTIESGIDFERRVADIYNTCRTPDEIQTSFDSLQEEMSTEIDEGMRATREKLLENFDAEVAEKLRVYKTDVSVSLDKYEALLWDLGRYELRNAAEFDETNLTFQLGTAPTTGIPTGVYTLRRDDEAGHHFRVGHPLSQHLLLEASGRPLEGVSLTFDYSGTPKKVTSLEAFVGAAGTLSVKRLTVSTVDAEDYILIAAERDDGIQLDAEQARRLFDFAATVQPEAVTANRSVEETLQTQENAILAEIADRNSAFFDDEMAKLEGWAADKKKSLEIQIKDLDVEIKQLKAEARRRASLEEKIELQRRVKALETKRSEVRKTLFKAQDEIDEQKDQVLDEVESRMRQRVESEELFSVRWRLV